MFPFHRRWKFFLISLSVAAAGLRRSSFKLNHAFGELTGQRLPIARRSR
jgi:hypothetical protein